ncbi:DUF488 domain-containing protein [Rhizobium sp. BR 315]|uniref:DUF488 domain-containing protein n=1 Tax=Rhizobium sp. BR 315 TaxID=3040014 RepID=UPI003D34AB0D
MHIKRIYEPAVEGDGTQVLVDRLWPHDTSKNEAHIHIWLGDIAPSADLRHWFGRDPKSDVSSVAAGRNSRGT